MSDFEPFETPDGKQLTLRALNENDTGLLIDLFHKLSSEAKRLRFHANVDHVDEDVVRREAQRLVDLDPERQFALVALDREQETEAAVGVARFDRLSENGTDAELAIVIRDDYQGQGLGRHLLETLTTVARRQNIERFVMLTTSDNSPMVNLVNEVWSEVEINTHQGEREIWAVIG